MTLPVLDLLYEPDELPAVALPVALAAAYGGSLGFDEPRVVANFVSTLDGVVAIPSVPESNKLVAAGSAADRFVLGLLRACADCLFIGSGTLLAAPRSLWTPEQAFPDAADAFAELRRRLGRPAQLEVAVLSASGAVNPAHPVFEQATVVLTTDDGARKLEERLPDTTTVISLGASLDPTEAVEALEERGHRLLVSEGGPTVHGSFLAAGLVDELFLTLSPLLVGRTTLDERLAVVEGADLLPDGVAGRLIGVRREGGHLFLRYELDRAGA